MGGWVEWVEWVGGMERERAYQTVPEHAGHHRVAVRHVGPGRRKVGGWMVSFVLSLLPTYPPTDLPLLVQGQDDHLEVEEGLVDVFGFLEGLPAHRGLMHAFAARCIYQ